MTEDLLVKNVEEQCAQAVYRLEQMFNDAENDQQRLDILKKLEPLLDSMRPIPESAIKLPEKVVTKGRPKGALGSRIPSGFEQVQSQSKKRKSSSSCDAQSVSPKPKRSTYDANSQQSSDRYALKLTRYSNSLTLESRSTISVLDQDAHTPKAEENHFTVDENIPRDNYITTMDVRGDGYCGFRVLALLIKGNENEFPSIKRAMLNELDSNIGVYQRYFNYPVERLRKIVAYGHDAESAIPEDVSTGCSYEYWFDANICAQLAADTFNTPIAIFSDAGKRTITTENGTKEVFIHPPITYLPYKGPIATNTPPVPLVMHFVHGNHWATVLMKRSRKMVWPPIAYKHKEVCSILGIDDKVRSFWNRHLSFKKVEKDTNINCPIVLD